MAIQFFLPLQSNYLSHLGTTISRLVYQCWLTMMMMMVVVTRSSSGIVTVIVMMIPLLLDGDGDGSCSLYGKVLEAVQEVFHLALCHLI